MSLKNAKMPRLADKLEAQEADLKAEEQAVEEELSAVKKAKKRASKKA